MTAGSAPESGNRVRFGLARYDCRHALLIGPIVLVYSTIWVARAATAESGSPWGNPPEHDEM
jgi:hypothetical protein